MKYAHIYNAQEIIELFNGDQHHVYQLLADALNSGADVGAIVKREIRLMEASAEDAAELLHIEMHGGDELQERPFVVTDRVAVAMFSQN